MAETAQAEERDAPVMPSPESKPDSYQLAALAGGNAYKALSFDLFDVHPGMRVLNVGWGIAGDVLALGQRVGSHGMVVGIEPDWDRLQEAQQAVAGQDNIVVERGEVERFVVAEGQFDRVRADWVLQHVPQPQLALANLWRALGPGGMLELVEPDWKALLLFPASPIGGDDDHTLQMTLNWYQQQMPHALIGRQLPGMVHQQQWVEQVDVQLGSLDWTSWRLADAVLRLSAAARALAVEQPGWQSEIDAWLWAVEAASRHGEFLASLPLVIVRAWKDRYIPLSGRPRQGGTTSPFGSTITGGGDV